MSEVEHKSLYEITGDIKDANTMLVSRELLRSQAAEIDTLSKTCGLAVVERDAMRAENDALRAENEALRRDAERYLLIGTESAKDYPTISVTVWGDGGNPHAGHRVTSKNELDTVCDTAMQQEKQDAE